MPPSPILVVDDDPLLLLLLEHKLRGAGHAVATAPDGLAALEAIPIVKPGIVVLDALMPRMDGFEVLRRIKSDASLSHLRIIMLTVLRHQDDVVGALKIGADDFLVKPFIPDELLARVARLAPSAAA
ncbi:MAG TPA: response regulator [Hyphomonadaceae bacterium]|nr:response regulator [Hyphomonadaceae bacterium]